MHLERGRRTPALGPVVPELTEEFPAGAVNFGVEYRNISGYKVPDFWEVPEGRRLNDNGVTLHVFDALDGAEHIRMDCFWADPHYHYSCPDSDEYLLGLYDTPANGEDMLGWAIDCFRSRLGPMLASTRGKHLAEKLNTALVAGALDQVEAAARRMEENPPDIAPSPPIAGVTV
jgi:hypothetical protein